jgi:DNA polymerase II small subunit/DNA polymerase delta subunit B
MMKFLKSLFSGKSEENSKVVEEETVEEVKEKEPIKTYYVVEYDQFMRGFGKCEVTVWKSFYNIGEAKDFTSFLADRFSRLRTYVSFYVIEYGSNIKEETVIKKIHEQFGSADEIDLHFRNGANDLYDEFRKSFLTREEIERGN